MKEETAVFRHPPKPVTGTSTTGTDHFGGLSIHFTHLTGGWTWRPQEQTALGGCSLSWGQVARIGTFRPFSRTKRSAERGCC